MSNFSKCLKEGQKYEKIYAEEYLKIEYVPNEDKLTRKHYDLSHGDLKYEIKADFMAQKTGNIFIEFISFNSPSGIATTHADFFVVFVGKEVYKIPTNVLKKCISDKAYFRIVSGGDKNASMGYLFKKDIFNSFKVVIN